MNKVYYLSSCDTNRKMMKELDLTGWQLREIKSQPITEAEIEEMRALAGSYQSLFSNRSTQIKTRNINVSDLTEDDYRKLILAHYTFLKRPVFITPDRIFVGNSRENIVKLKDYVNDGLFMDDAVLTKKK